MGGVLLGMVWTASLLPLTEDPVSCLCTCWCVHEKEKVYYLIVQVSWIIILFRANDRSSERMIQALQKGIKAFSEKREGQRGAAHKTAAQLNISTFVLKMKFLTSKQR